MEALSMKIKLLALSFVSFAAIAIGNSAAEEPAASAPVEEPRALSPDHYGASFRLGFNINASFKNSGAYNGQGHLVPVPGQGLQYQNGNPNGDANGNRTYEDGYIWRDSSGNTLGYSRYWGYDSASQYNPANGTIAMHSSSSPGVDSSGRNGDPALGFEISYQRDFDTKPDRRWGIEATFNYMNVGIHDDAPLTGRGTFLTDSYQLPTTEGGGFVIAPPAPYAHGPDLSASGNPVITSTPASRTMDPVVTRITGSRNLDANVFGWHVGPYFVVPLGSKAALEVSGGLAVAVVLSDFNFSETIMTPTVQASVAHGNSQSQVGAGGFVSGNFTLALSERWKILAGCQFQNVGRYDNEVAGRQARLDLSKSVFVCAGAIFSF